MLTSSTHGVKGALLRTYKEGGRRVAEPQQHDGLLQYYSTLLPHTDPTRAISKLHSYLLEGDLRQLWQQGKQRLKTRLRDAHSVYKQPLEQQQQGGSSVATRATAAQLEHLYGTNGVFRVRARLLAPASGRPSPPGYLAQLPGCRMHVAGEQQACPLPAACD
jgi:hypothetical protein